LEKLFDHIKIQRCTTSKYKGKGRLNIPGSGVKEVVLRLGGKADFILANALTQ
jgi:hypothetical protein